MKFVHIADVHFDMPFILLSSKGNMGEKRRLDQRIAFQKVIDYIIQNNVEYLFISGDLYENEHIKTSTIEYINNQFKRIPNTKVYIVAGNHDPFLKNSPYNTFSWNDNVTIFTSEIGVFEEKDACIYGFGFDDFTMEESPINLIEIENKNKLNILLMHSSLNASTTLERAYNPLTINQVNLFGFDYVALGHIHKKGFFDKNVVYPGSLVSLGFDEPDEHGMIVGEFNDSKELKLEFIPIDNKEFITEEIDVSSMVSKEDIIYKLDSIFEENKMYKVILTGIRNFEINTVEILSLISNTNILKLEDSTKIGYDLESIKMQNSLKGIFVKEMLEKIENNPEQEEIIKKAIEVGLEAL